MLVPMQITVHPEFAGLCFVRADMPGRTSLLSLVYFKTTSIHLGYIICGDTLAEQAIHGEVQLLCCLGSFAGTHATPPAPMHRNLAVFEIVVCYASCRSMEFIELYIYIY